MLREPFGFHELSIEDALSAMHHPKVESYGTYLYLIVHGIAFKQSEHHFATHDYDFFLGKSFLVTVHDGSSRSIPHVRGLCGKSAHILDEGPLALSHRIIDVMIEHYEPEMDALRAEIDELERAIFERPSPDRMRDILALQRDVASLRSVVLPQRDVIGRLARREFPLIDEALGYRFRDLHDQLVRLADEASHFHDRISGLLDAHLASVSNQLNQVMKVLTVIATVFMPLTVVTGLYGMNVVLPTLPGGPSAQFWWVMGIMAALSAAMLGYFRSQKWL
jgi:magnesium transporter